MVNLHNSQIVSTSFNNSSWRGEKFLIKNPPTNLAKKDVEIRIYRDKTSKVLFAGRELQLEKVHKPSLFNLNAA